MAFEPIIGIPNPNVEAMPVRIVGTDPSGSTLGVSNRPSSKEGRVRKVLTVDNQVAGQIVYTVTNGKTLYILSALISGFNTGAPARLRIKDNTTVLISLHATGTGLGVLSGATPLNVVPLLFPEPLPFSTSVVTDLPSGTLIYSITLIGYEE